MVTGFQPRPRSVLGTENRQLVSDGDDFEGHLMATADGRYQAVEDCNEDAEHGVATCHGLQQTSTIPARTEFSTGTGAATGRQLHYLMVVPP